MEIRFEDAGTGDGTMRVFSAPGGILVGYIRREDGEVVACARRWVLVDHIAGQYVETAYSSNMHPVAVKAREYFAGRQFCCEGCGRLAVLPNETCRNCLAANADRIALALGKTTPALCYVRSVYGDIYKVVRMDDETDARVLVGNIDRWAPTIYRAWEILDSIGKGLYQVVPAAEIASVPGL